jgi:hypothetical protein
MALIIVISDDDVNSPGWKGGVDVNDISRVGFKNQYFNWLQSAK